MLIAFLMNDATRRGFNWVMWESYKSADTRKDQQNQKPTLPLRSLIYIFRYFPTESLPVFLSLVKIFNIFTKIKDNSKIKIIQKHLVKIFPH